MHLITYTTRKDPKTFVKYPKQHVLNQVCKDVYKIK